MSTLTPQEKAVGRRFLDAEQAILSDLFVRDPPTYLVPHFLALYRHLCAGRGGRSTALTLHEVYLTSPQYPESEVPAGRFGFIYRQGQCRGCGQTARSNSGRLVGWDRPPIHGRVARS